MSQKALHRLSRFYHRVINRAMGRKGYATARRYRKKRSRVIRILRHNRRVIALRKSTKAASAGFVWFDGHQVCGWLAAELQKARRAGRWKGVVVSGYRTPSYSRSLCLRMCGAPTCRGRCAGVNTNHAKGPAFPLGAVDVTQFWTLQAECRRLGLRIHNGLPATDPVHFSHAGN